MMKTDQNIAIAEEVREQLKRVLGSKTFRLAQSQQKFLKYTVEETLAGRGDLIKEYLIGTEALGRGEAFDPRLDPIVRTQARKLRARLALYYQTEGIAERLRIEYPKGSYVAVFQENVPFETHVDPEADFAEPLPETLAETPVPFNSAISTSQGSKWRSRWIAIPACVFLGLTTWFVSWGFESRRQSTNVASVAVLPFTNLTDGGSDDFLSYGLAEEVINLLQETSGLQVVPRTSSFRFSSKSPHLAALTRDLKVRTVLVGSLRKSQGRITVTVQLNDGDGYHLWSGTYDRSQDNTPSIPHEIAHAVINALAVRPIGRAGGEVGPLSELGPAPGAHEKYLKGLYFFNKLDAGSLATAIEYLQEAIAEDPSYARAYSALADCYVIAPQVATMAPLEMVPKIEASASTALALNPNLSEPYIDLAVAAEYQYDWKTAERAFQRGLELNPENVVGHLWYAKYLGIVGRRSELLTQRRLAAQLDPVSPYAIQSVAGYLSVSGEYDQAIEQFRAALALEPNFGLAHQGLGVAYLLSGSKVEAIRELQLAAALMSGPRRTALLGFAYATTGDTAKAKRILADFLDRSKRGNFPALAVALVYIGLDDKDLAFDWLNKAIDQRDLNLDLQWDSFYTILRSDPRYTNLLRRMKLI